MIEREEGLIERLKVMSWEEIQVLADEFEERGREWTAFWLRYVPTLVNGELIRDNPFWWESFSHQILNNTPPVHISSTGWWCYPHHLVEASE